jgi:hypothetical protein
MDILVNLLIGILGSLIAGIIVVMGGAAFSKKTRAILTAILGRILNIDTEYVFENQNDVAADLRKELSRASSVDLLTGRGTELQRDTFAPILQQDGRRKRVRVLLPIARPRAESYDWTGQRERELATFDPSYAAGALREQIEANIRMLEPLAEQGSIQLRFFNGPHIGRIILTEHYAYLTPYRQDAHGRDTRIIKYRRGGEMYDWLSRIFEQLWEAQT